MTPRLASLPISADTQRALKEVLGYRLYRDLRRGWRLTSPNLEQCGLLEITYNSLTELCADKAEWSDKHPVLAGASPATRAIVAKVLLVPAEGEYELTEPPISEEELQRREQSQTWHSTVDMLAHLRSLEQD